MPGRGEPAADRRVVRDPQRARRRAAQVTPQAGSQTLNGFAGRAIRSAWRPPATGSTLLAGDPHQPSWDDPSPPSPDPASATVLQPPCREPSGLPLSAATSRRSVAPPSRRSRPPPRSRVHSAQSDRVADHLHHLARPLPHDLTPPPTAPWASSWPCSFGSSSPPPSSSSQPHSHQHSPTAATCSNHTSEGGHPD